MTMTSAQALRRPGGVSRVAGLIRGAIETALLWCRRGRDRRDLASLNDRMLLDMGVTRADVEREYRKPFWRD
ncbi:MAG TPA: DUF1127 domain-containing protein [Candidatus Acidoferrum sp.]|nr:DUF1127 domain-containing protein [Candidatus Acidoferrum sp.]